MTKPTTISHESPNDCRAPTGPLTECSVQTAPSDGIPEALASALRSPMFQRELCGYSQRLRHDDREEVLSQTLLKLCGQAVGGHYDPERGNAIQFAIGVLRLTAREVQRQRKRNLVPIASECPRLEHRPGPLEYLIQAERAEAVRSAVGALAPGDRELVLMRYGLGTEERTTMTSSDRCRLFRVLARLRDSLGHLE